jgi:hypothetical protein
LSRKRLNETRTQEAKMPFEAEQVAELVAVEAPPQEDRATILAASEVAHRYVEQELPYLFERKWLPLVKGVHLISCEAFKSFSDRQRKKRTKSDGTPDWTDHNLQQKFKELSEGLSWENYFTTRRSLLTAIRKIGENLDNFLAWYNLSENKRLRETLNHPEWLWRKYEAKDKDRSHDNPADPTPVDPANPVDPTAGDPVDPIEDPAPVDPDAAEEQAEIDQIESLNRDLDRHLSFPQLWARRLRARGEDCVVHWLNDNLPQVIEEGDDDDNPMVVLRYLLLNPEDDIEPLIPAQAVATPVTKLPKVKKAKTAGKGAPKGVKVKAKRPKAKAKKKVK